MCYGPHVSRRRRACILGLSLAVVVPLAPGLARAQVDMREQARAHYDMGTGAYVRADYKTAAQEFALADRMSPSNVALSAALDAAIQADMPALGMELVARSSRATLDAATSALVTKARARFGKRVGRIRVACAPAPCVAKIDGAQIEIDADQFVTVGRHVVTTDRREGERVVDVAAESRTDIVVDGGNANATSPPNATSNATSTPNATATATPNATPNATDSSGISPVWFFTAAGITAALGTVTVLSAIDTQNKHSDYFNQRCDRFGSTSCATMQNDGVSAQHRTNILLGVASAAAVGTAVLGIFFVRWRTSVSATVVGSAASAQLRVAWP